MSGSARATWRFLAAESPSTPMHNATVEIFEPRRLGLRLRPAARADRGPDLVRAALPPAGPGRARPARQPGVGRRRGLRPRLPRTPLGAAAAGQPRPAARAGRPDRLPAAGPQPPAVGDVRRRGARRAARSRCSRSRTRCWSTASTPSTSARCCSTAPPSPRSSAPTSGARAGAPVAVGLVADAVRDIGLRAGHRRRHGAHAAPAPCCATADGALHRTGRVVERARRPPPRARVPDHRRALAAAPGRHGAHRPRRLPHGPRGARRHGQRRRAGHRHRRAARLADDPRGVDARPAPDPRRSCRSR